MNNAQFQSELLYQCTMLHAKQLLEEGILSQATFDMFQQKMMAMYYPIFSKYMDETLDKYSVLSDI